MKSKEFLKPYIIAEIAQTHEGSLGIAHSMIDMAAKSGASAVKFQCHFASEESSKDEPWRIKLRTQDKTRYDYWKRMEFSEDSWLDLREHAKDLKIDFICSPFSLKAVKLLEKIDIDGWKIASGEVTNFQLLEKISKSNKKIFISSGLSKVSEIKKALDILQKNNSEVVLMQCTSQYPVTPKNLGLNIIQDYMDEFDLNIGFSDHSGNIYSSLAALTMGVRHIEVHVTFHKEIFGPDVSSSLDPVELSSLVEGARWICEAQENPVDKDKVAKELSNMRKIFFKSIIANKHISKGETIKPEHLSTKKPLVGVGADKWFEVIGSKANKDIKKGSYISKGDFQE
tara:strand:- start:1030 stop:2052 length:1023 start_codon:yes stop_codon:yes gene_type:complete